jgi:hypothetical protein
LQVAAKVERRGIIEHAVLLASRRRLLLAIAALELGCAKHSEPAAAGACANNTRADAFATGLTKRGDKSHFELKLLSASPAPPSRGDNTWIVELDAIGGGAVSGATITATPFMPDHGHGTPAMVHVTPLSTAGQYQLAPINMWMPGYWETSITVAAGDLHDAATFKFCIPN